MYYIASIVPKKPPAALTREEVLVLLGSKSKEFEKKTVSYRLTAEARRILDMEAKRLGVDKTKALEIILREYHRSRGRK